MWSNPVGCGTTGPKGALCEQQLFHLINTTNYTAIHSNVMPNCGEFNDHIDCYSDVAGPYSSVATACANVGGKRYTFNESLKCNFTTSEGKEGKVSATFWNVGLCVGMDCSTSYLEASLQQRESSLHSILEKATTNATQTLAQVFSETCEIGGVASSSTRLLLLMTGAVSITLSLVGQLVVMFMA